MSENMSAIPNEAASADQSRPRRTRPLPITTVNPNDAPYTVRDAALRARIGRALDAAAPLGHSAMVSLDGWS